MLSGLRLYAAIAALVVIISGVVWAGGTVLHWRSQARQVPALTRERDAARAETVAVRRAAERERVRADAAVRGYVDEVESNRRRQRPVAGPIRLCVQPATSNVPAASGPAVDPDAAAAGAGQLPGPAGGDHPAGPDIGPDLRQLADDADAVTAQCRALQGWIRAQ